MEIPQKRYHLIKPSCTHCGGNYAEGWLASIGAKERQVPAYPRRTPSESRSVMLNLRHSCRKSGLLSSGICTISSYR